MANPSQTSAAASQISWVLNQTKLPHTPLDQGKDYTFSEISDNCRANNATFLRMHLPKQELRKKLHYISTALPAGDYFLVGVKPSKAGRAAATRCGLLHKAHERVGVYREGEDEVDVSAKVCGDEHPMEELFADIYMLFFLSQKFEETHLVRTGLYRKRKSRQLAKAIAKREKNAAKGKSTKKVKSAKQKKAPARIAKG